jgi:hypothetical protein
VGGGEKSSSAKLLHDFCTKQFNAVWLAAAGKRDCLTRRVVFDPKRQVQINWSRRIDFAWPESRFISEDSSQYQLSGLGLLYCAVEIYILMCLLLQVAFPLPKPHI